jgi:hypothetical protein
MTSLRLLPGLLVLAALLAALPARAASYALCIHETPAQIAARTDPKTGPAYWASFATFADKLVAAGVMRGGSAFDTAAPAKIIKSGDAVTAATTEPSAAATFGGYFIIEVPTEADALAWAARVPNPGGHVTVRLLLPMMAK